jgi:hypothetical protein
LNPLDSVQRDRLFRACEHSYSSLRPFRNVTAAYVEDFCGSGFGQPKSKREILINLMRQNVVASVMNLAANRPRITADAPDNVLLQPFAKKLALAMNNLAREIALEVTLRKWVVDAFFCIGLIKLHRADSGLIEIEPDILMDPGIPFASNISLDNWVHDVSASSWDRLQFCGDWYRLPLEAVRASDAFDPKLTRELAATSKYSEDQRQDELARGQDVDYDELQDMVDLCDLYIPADDMVYTFALEGGHSFRPKGPPLAALPAQRDRNPYKRLAFHEVPENIMPASQAGDIASLARLANNLIRKASRQAHRQKEITIYASSAAEDAKRVQRESDGGMVQVDDPNSIKTLKFGGADPATMKMLDWTLMTADRMAGNITAKLGLGAQTPTLGQEELVHGAVDGVQANQQQRFYEAAVDLVSDLGLLLWEDKFRTSPGQIEVAEGYSYDASWTPDERIGQFFDYQLGIDVHSMPYQSPKAKAATIDGLLQKYLSLGPLLTSQGGTINVQTAVELDAELHNEPRIKQLIQFTNLTEPTATEEGGGLPAETTRRYVRESRSAGGTPEAQTRDRMKQWDSLAQQSEAAQAA